MISLQSLRSKGGIILTIFIGVALLAFVLGDLMSSGSVLLGNNNSKIGEIDGTKVTAQEYQNQMHLLTEVRKMTQGDTQTSEDVQAIREQTWDYLVRIHALKPALVEAGITVSQEELKDLFVGNNISPMIYQTFRDPQTGVFSMEMMQGFMTNKAQDKTGRMQMFWSYLEREVADYAQMMKYKNLIDKSTFVTKFEAEKMAALESNNLAVTFVASKYADIADSTINVTDSEIKDFYKKHPRMFKAENSRTIDYVLFQVLPSAEDFTAASEYIQGLANDFRQTNDVMTFAELNNSRNTDVDKRYYKQGELSGELNDFAFTAPADSVFGPVLANGEQYTLSRIADTKIIPDSVKFSHIVLYANQKETADSLFSALKKGGDFAEAAEKFSADPQSSQKGGEVGMFDPQTMTPEFSEPLMKAKKGEMITVTTPQSIHIIKIEDVKGESKKVQLATIKYTVEASENTRSIIYNQATEFASAARKEFDKVVNEKSLAKRTAQVGGNDNDIQGLSQSSDVASWAFRGKVKDVSDVLESANGNTFVVASLKKITEEGVSPLEDVKDPIKAILARLKKGEMLAEKMKGATSIDDLAAKLSLTPIEASDINITSYVVPEVGFDPAFAGGVCAMDPSKISKPIVGLSAVYVAQITGTSQNPADVEVVKSRMTAEAQQRAFTISYQAFLELCNNKDMRYKMK